MTQVAWVKEVLKENGEISRNFALRNYVSRLGALICTLKKQGMNIDTEWRANNTPFGKRKDYIYKLKN